MNPLTKAIDEIRYNIPKEVLNQAFITQDMTTCGALISLETRIREAVLEPRVLVDMDLIGGTETFIDLRAPVRSEYIDPFTVIYYIPDEMTQNRAIVQAYSIHFGILGYTNAAHAMSYADSTLGSEMRKVLDSAMKVPPAATSYLNLIAHNTIMCRFAYMPYSAAFMRCRLGNDEQLSNIRPTIIPEFAKLCVLAVKAYIYNTTTIPMGQAYLSGGQALGVFQDIVMGFSDAEQMYQDQLKKWKKLMVYADPEAKRRYLRTIVGVN